MTNLLTMYQDIPPTPQRRLDMVANGLQVRSEIHGGSVEDLNTVAIEAVFFREGNPRGVKDLDEVSDVVREEIVFVGEGGDGADVECPDGRGR